MAGARHVDDARAPRVDLGELLVGDGPSTLGGAPVVVIAVLDDQAEWAAKRAAMAHAAKDRGLVGLDCLARRAAVARLTASQIALQPLAVGMQAGGQAREDRDDAGAVRLAGGDERQCHWSLQGIADRSPATAHALLTRTLR